MSVKTALDDQGNTLTLIIEGTLGNDIHKAFRDAYENNSTQKYVVDLRNAQNIDSSGLGMLLLFRDYAGGDESKIQLINCSDHVLEIFHVTCFYKLFDIPQYKPR